MTSEYVEYHYSPSVTCVKFEYHVISDIALWLRLKSDKTEIIHIEIGGDCPHFVFDVKFRTKGNVVHKYILAHIVPMLHHIRDFIRLNNIQYKPTGIIEFVFNLHEPIDQSEIMKYRIPASKEIAEQVCGYYFRYGDQLEATFDDDLIIYYYMCVFVYIDHPVFNGVLQRFTSGLNEGNFRLTTFTGFDTNAVTDDGFSLKQNINFIGETQNITDIGIIQLYTDVLYFLSLVVEPEDPQSLEQQVYERTIVLCHKMGLKLPNKMIKRGRAWKIIRHFFETKSIFRAALVECVIDPPSCEREMNFGECLIMNQLKQMWKWYKLQDFHECYVWATNPNSKAHHLPTIVKERQAVINLYQCLWEKARHDDRVPYSGFYESDEFLEKFNMKKYPSLMYAVKKKARNDNQQRRKEWDRLVASLPLGFPRLEIDKRLDIPNPEVEDQPTGAYIVVTQRY